VVASDRDTIPSLTEEKEKGLGPQRPHDAAGHVLVEGSGRQTSASSMRSIVAPLGHGGIAQAGVAEGKLRPLGRDQLDHPPVAGSGEVVQVYHLVRCGLALGRVQSRDRLEDAGRRPRPDPAVQVKAGVTSTAWSGMSATAQSCV
jgi:hypothetical protein